MGATDSLTIAGLPFDEIYRRHAPAVRGYCIKMTGDPVTGQDLVSETFARAYQAGRRFVDQGKPVRAWLITIARNLVRDHCRSANERLTVSLRDTHVVDAVTAEDDPAMALLLHDVNKRIYEAMRLLTLLQRECVFLRFVAGKSVQETARLLGRNELAVRAMQHRAIRKLRQLLRADGVECSDLYVYPVETETYALAGSSLERVSRAAA